MLYYLKRRYTAGDLAQSDPQSLSKNSKYEKDANARLAGSWKAIRESRQRVYDIWIKVLN